MEGSGVSVFAPGTASNVEAPPSVLDLSLAACIAGEGEGRGRSRPLKTTTASSTVAGLTKVALPNFPIVLKRNSFRRQRVKSRELERKHKELQNKTKER
jgi:hypothetical protein